MDLPQVITEITDQRNRVFWKIRAYRTVTEQEARIAISEYARQHGKPKPNTQIEVITIIGHSE